jgi:hypothetical protein
VVRGGGVYGVLLVLLFAIPRFLRLEPREPLPGIVAMHGKVPRLVYWQLFYSEVYAAS